MNNLKEREETRGNYVFYIMQHVESMWMCAMSGRVGEGNISSKGEREAAFYITLWCHSVWCHQGSQMKLQSIQRVEAFMLNLFPQCVLEFRYYMWFTIIGASDKFNHVLQPESGSFESTHGTLTCVPWVFAIDPLWAQAQDLLQLILTVCIKSAVSTIFPVHCYRSYMEFNNNP